MPGTAYLPMPWGEMRRDLTEAVSLLREIERSLNETATMTGRCPLCLKVDGRRHDPTCRLGVFLTRMARVPEEEWRGDKWRDLR